MRERKGEDETVSLPNSGMISQRISTICPAIKRSRLFRLHLGCSSATVHLGHGCGQLRLQQTKYTTKSPPAPHPPTRPQPAHVARRRIETHINPPPKKNSGALTLDMPRVVILLLSGGPSMPYPYPDSAPKENWQPLDTGRYVTSMAREGQVQHQNAPRKRLHKRSLCRSVLALNETKIQGKEPEVFLHRTILEVLFY